MLAELVQRQGQRLGDLPQHRRRRGGGIQLLHPGWLHGGWQGRIRLGQGRWLADVDAHAHHHKALPAQHAHFHQNAAELALAVPEVVRPFQAQLMPVLRIQTVRQAAAHHQRQARQVAVLQRQPEREGERSAHRLGAQPLLAHAAAAGLLLLGHQQHRLQVAVTGALHQRGVGRIELGQHFHAETGPGRLDAVPQGFGGPLQGQGGHGRGLRPDTAEECASL